MHKNYFLFSEIKGIANLNIDSANYNQLLKYLLNGTEYTFKKDSGIYLIGERNLEGLRNTEIVALKYRTVDKIQDIIPPDLKKGIEAWLESWRSRRQPDLTGLGSRLHDR